MVCDKPLSNPHTTHVTAEGIREAFLLAMSTKTDSPTVECHYPDCDTFGPHWKFRHGRYCRTDCEHRHDGRKKLARFRYDHCRCFSCFRELKTVNPPKPDFEFTENGHGWTLDPETREPRLQYYGQDVSRQAATGFQFETEHATKGEKQRSNGDGTAVRTGTICRACGNTDHTSHDSLLADHEAIGRLVTLLDEADDIVFDPGLLHRVYHHTHDLDLAVGRALAARQEA
jgi:hypothetical protein